MADLITVQSGDTLKDVIQLLPRVQSNVVYVNVDAVPLLQTPRAISLLAKAAREINKKLILISANSKSRKYAESINVASLSSGDYFKQTNKSSSKPFAPKPLSKKGKVKRGDIYVIPKSNRPKKQLSREAREQRNKETIKQESARQIINNQKKTKPKKKKKGVKIAMFAGSLILALAAGFVAANMLLQNATITVLAATKNFSSNFDFFVDAGESADMKTGKKIKGIKINQTVSASYTAKTTGEQNSGTQSQGQVFIHSRFGNILRLNTSTTFLTGPDGQVYHLTQDVVNLRANTPYPVNVISANGGEQMNLEPNTRLEVHNQVLGHRPDSLFAAAGEQGITGGSNQYTKVVTETDVINAREEIKNILIEKLRKSLNDSDKIVFLPNLAQVQFTEENLSAAAGEAAEEFTIQVSANISGVAFNIQNLEPIIQAHLAEVLPAGERFLSFNHDSNRFDVQSLDLENGMAVLNVNYETKTVAELNQQGLQTILAGKTPQQIEELLLNKPEIKAVQIKLNPFWLKKTPSSIDKIEIEIKNS